MKGACVLKISSFTGIAFNAEHYYGHLQGYSEKGKYTEIELRKVLNKRDAEYLNKKDSGMFLKEGFETCRFDSKQEVEEKALEVWNDYFPNCTILLEGSFAVADPQRCLVAPVGLKDKINSLYEEQERIGGYEGNWRRSEEIYSEYKKLINDYLKSKESEVE